MRYLGIDFGTKKIGLSLSDEGGNLAFPYKIIKNHPHVANDLSDIVEKENIQSIVIGHSKDTFGADNKLMEDINDLIGQLSLTTNLPIHLQPEEFTSLEAKRPPNFSGSNRRNQANQRGKLKTDKPIDHSAAALILQRYLDKNHD